MICETVSDSNRFDDLFLVWGWNCLWHLSGEKGGEDESDRCTATVVKEKR